MRFVDGRAFANRYAFTLRDMLADTPGVFVQNRYGQELRLSVRGSGIGRGFHLRVGESSRRAVRDANGHGAGSDLSLHRAMG